MANVKIKKSDKSRILLTELLPYEVPMLFSNEGFYSVIKRDSFSYFKEKIFKLCGLDYSLPFTYKIKKNISGETRTLSIIHPLIQIEFIGLFDNYDSLMVNLCSRSPFSLRKIKSITKFYTEPSFIFNEEELKSAEKNVEPEGLDPESMFIRSYFTYEPIDLIYKFYDRSDFRRLEQRFNYLLEFDISKCFYHIYSHSLSWSIKNKESAKLNRKKQTFENVFDKLMQRSNYNETNGIVVGPEISRIFAEIILQKVDLNSLKKFEEKGYKVGVDYDVRRYVDDYFVFSNDLNKLNEIKKIYTEQLQFYKLYLNDNKSEIKVSPFISELTVGKLELNEYLDVFFNSLFDVREVDGKNLKQFKVLDRPFSLSNKFIKYFQVIVKRNNLSYDALGKDVVRFFRSKLVLVLKEKGFIFDIDQSEGFFLVILDIVFYSYSVNVNSNTTFKVAQIIVFVVKCIDKFDRVDIRHTVFGKIYKDCEMLLSNFMIKHKESETSIETLNLLIALKSLRGVYAFSVKKLAGMFYFKDDDSEFLPELNYFQIVTLLYYIGNDIRFSDLKKSVVSIAWKKFEKENVFLDSELFILFFDLVNCPYINIKDKRTLLKLVKFVVGDNISRNVIDQEIDLIKKQNKWFMNWDEEVDLEVVLKKKEWSSSY